MNFVFVVAAGISPKVISFKPTGELKQVSSCTFCVCKYQNLFLFCCSKSPSFKWKDKMTSYVWICRRMISQSGNGRWSPQLEACDPSSVLQLFTMKIKYFEFQWNKIYLNWTISSSYFVEDSAILRPALWLWEISWGMENDSKSINSWSQLTNWHNVSKQIKTAYLSSVFVVYTYWDIIDWYF